jgi:hypothetical protein
VTAFKKRVVIISDIKKNGTIMTPNNGDDANAVEAESVDTEEERKLKYERWNTVVHRYAGLELFRYVQFINRDTEIAYGSQIQKVVCKQCAIPRKEEEKYWASSEREELVMVIGRRRQAVTASMKARFGSEYRLTFVMRGKLLQTSA